MDPFGCPLIRPIRRGHSNMMEIEYTIKWQTCNDFKYIQVSGRFIHIIKVSKSKCLKSKVTILLLRYFSRVKLSHFLTFMLFWQHQSFHISGLQEYAESASRCMQVHNYMCMSQNASFCHIMTWIQYDYKGKFFLCYKGFRRGVSFGLCDVN